MPITSDVTTATRLRRTFHSTKLTSINSKGAVVPIGIRRAPNRVFLAVVVIGSCVGGALDVKLFHHPLEVILVVVDVGGEVAYVGDSGAAGGLGGVLAARLIRNCMVVFYFCVCACVFFNIRPSYSTKKFGEIEEIQL